MLKVSVAESHLFRLSECNNLFGVLLLCLCVWIQYSTLAWSCGKVVLEKKKLDKFSLYLFFSDSDGNQKCL